LVGCIQIVLCLGWLYSDCPLSWLVLFRLSFVLVGCIQIAHCLVGCIQIAPSVVGCMHIVICLDWLYSDYPLPCLIVVRLFVLVGCIPNVVG